jgi:hypothetical protein
MAVAVPTVTGYSGFWERTGNEGAYAPLSRNAQGWRSKLEWQIAALFDKQQMREQKELMLTLLGVAPGSTAAATYKRVQAPAGPSGTTPAVTGTADLGGLVPIETVSVINRATTAADVTYLTEIFDGRMVVGPSSLTLVADASGNGGGGKANW